MITIEEIRERIEKSENPLFFFDDDPDGLSSYLLLKRHFGKGKGISVKDVPDYNESFARKVDEHSPDLIVILDVYDINHEFVENVNVPVIWIDHHMPVKKPGVHYFNPRLLDKNDNRPTSYWCYQITKHDFWVAMTGIVADWHLEMIDELRKQYPDLLAESVKVPGDVIYNSKYGELIRMFAFLLKGKVSEVRRNISILTKIKDPYELLNKTTARARFVFKRFEKINNEYKMLRDKAFKTKPGNNVLAFTYPSTKTSFSAELSNELIYHFNDKIVVVARDKDDYYRVSVRTGSNGINLNALNSKILNDVNGNIGGHDHAMGGTIKKEDFNKFISNLELYAGK